MQQGRSEVGSVFVVDPDAFAHLVVRSTQACGGLRAAARRIGISASQLSRLSRNPGGRINRTTLQKLQRLAPQQLRAALAACLLSPSAQEGVRRRSAAWTADLRRRLRQLKANLTDVMALLDRVGRQTLASLAPAAYRWSQGDDEQEMALLLASWWRVVEPLLQDGPLGGDWRSMRDAELRAFVSAGIARERILLRPLPPLPARAPRASVLQMAIAQLRRRALRGKLNVRVDPRELYRLEKRRAEERKKRPHS